MATQQRDTKASPGPRGARNRPLTTHGAQEEEQNQRSPDRTVQHLRPSDYAHISAQRESHAGEQGSGVRTFQIPAQPVAEERSLDVDQNEIPIQMREGNTAIVQGGEKE